MQAAKNCATEVRFTAQKALVLRSKTQHVHNGGSGGGCEPIGHAPAHDQPAHPERRLENSTMTDIIRPTDGNWLLPPETELTFTAAAALSRDSFTIAASVAGAEHDEFDNFCRLFRWENGDWLCAELDQYAGSIITYQAPGWPQAGYVILGQTAQVIFLGPTTWSENILGGPGDEEPVYGAATRMRSVGGTLFACGLGGQIYRREQEGWVDFSRLRHTPRPGPGRDRDGNYHTRERLLLADSRFAFEDIASHDLTDYYACGLRDGFKGFLLYRGADGAWERLSFADDAQGLYQVLVEGPDDVWVAGMESLLLHGSRRTGFRQVPSEVPGVTLESLVRYQGVLYAGGSTGLLRLVDGRLVACRTSRPVSIVPGVGRPRVDDTQHLQVAGGMLWNFGYHGIQRFDGTTWEEITIPPLVMP